MKTALALLLLGVLSGCSCGTHVGLMTGTTIGIEISTGATNTTAPITFVLGYRRAEILVTPTNTTKVPSVLSKVAGNIGAGGTDVDLSGDQYLAVGKAAEVLAEEIHFVE